MSFSRHLFWITCLLPTLVACDGPDTDSIHKQSGFVLQTIPSFQSPLWTGTSPTETDPVVMTVDGTPITVSMVQRQLERSEPGTDPQVVLDRMIEFELLAREAYRAGKYVENVVQVPMQRALASRWLTTTFDQTLTPDDIPLELVEMRFKEVRSFYNHYEGFKILDVQIMCCMDTGDQDNCYRDELDDVTDRRQRLSDCLAHHEPSMRALHQQLSTEAVVQNRDSFENAVNTALVNYPSQALRDQYGTSTVLHDYVFQYDVDRSYEEQFEKVRYRMFYKEIMDGVRDSYLQNQSKAPFLTPIIRSPIGWHILYVHEVIPERHESLANPKVNKQVREKLFDIWRTQQKFPEVMHELCVKQGCSDEFCSDWLRHWVCIEQVRTSKEHSNHELIRQQCDAILIADIQHEPEGCFLRAHRIVPLQELQEKK